MPNKDICELCGRFDAEFDDPTWDKSLPSSVRPERPLRLCDLCAAERIERKMYEVVN